MRMGSQQLDPPSVPSNQTESSGGDMVRLHLHFSSFLSHCKFIYAILDNPQLAYMLPSKREGIVQARINLNKTICLFESIVSESTEPAAGHFLSSSNDSAIVSISEPDREDDAIVQTQICKGEDEEDKIPCSLAADPDATDSENDFATGNSHVDNAGIVDDTVAIRNQAPSFHRPHSPDTHRRRRKLIDITADGHRIPWDSDNSGRHTSEDGERFLEKREPLPSHRLEKPSCTTMARVKARKHWSAAETAVFIDLLNQYGRGEWNRMAKTNRLQRDNVQLKDKWRSMIMSGKLGFSATRGFFEYDPSRDPPKYQLRE